jgi:hypothetical protein
MSRVFSHPAWIAGLLLLAPAAPAASGPARANTGYQVPNSLPNGIADPDGKMGYFRAAGNRIEAVNLATGRVIWKTAAAAWPLAVFCGEAVVAVRVKGRRDRVRIAVLDGDGVDSFQSQEIKVPGAREDHDGSWTARAFLDGNDLLLDWWAYWSKRGSVRGEGHLQDGLLRVNLKTGKVVALDRKDRSLRPPLRLCDRMEKELKVLLADSRYFWRESWSKPPQGLIDGNRLAVVSREVDGDEVLTLRNWDVRTGKDSRTKKLLRRERGCWKGASGDERFLFLQHEQKGGRDRPLLYTWNIYRTATGQRVGRFLHDGYIINAGVVGGRLFVVEDKPTTGPQQVVSELEARDLKTGKLLWKRPVPIIPSTFPLDAR